MHQLARMNKMGVHRATLQVDFDDLTDAATSQSFDFAEALPEGAHVLSAGIEIITPFDDGSTGVYTADLGISGGDTDAFLDGIDIEAAAGAYAAPQGVQPCGMVGAITPALLVDAGAVNVDTTIAGSLKAHILYAVGG